MLEQPDGKVYEGQFDNGVQSGLGKATTKGKEVFGLWEKGKLARKGGKKKWQAKRAELVQP